MKKTQTFILLACLLFSFTLHAQFPQIGQDIDGEARDESGSSVSLSADGTTVAIGVRQTYLYDERGYVRVYRNVSGTWKQLGRDIDRDIDGEVVYDQSGFLVSISSDGTTVAIGAPRNDGTARDAGHVRVYRYAANAWTQLGRDIDGEAEDDFSGSSVSLSADGTTVAIGASDNDGTARDAGHVRVYRYASNTWTKLGQDIDGEAEEDGSGSSVSLSADGTTVAIGAPYNDGTASNAGHVQVYRYASNTWTQLGRDIDGEAEDDISGNKFGRHHRSHRGAL